MTKFKNTLMNNIIESVNDLYKHTSTWGKVLLFFLLLAVIFFISKSFDKSQKKEGFTEAASNDEGNLRLGYGTDKILDPGATTLRLVKAGDRTTREQAAKVLEMQVKTTYKDKVVGTGDAQITEAEWNMLNDRQRAACVSFVYNCGSFGFYPHIPASIRAKNYIAAANGILNGPIGGAQSGNVYSGLVRRRAEEAGMFAYGL